MAAQSLCASSHLFRAALPLMVFLISCGGGGTTASRPSSPNGTGAGNGTGTGTGTGANTPGLLAAINDTTGSVQSFAADASTQLDTSNAFFQSLGTNGRTCNTCHQEGDGWGLSGADAHDRFFGNNLGVNDPLFSVVDGANCDHDANNNPIDLSSADARSDAFTLLSQGRGLIRISLPLPANAEFSIKTITNPNPVGCTEKNPLSVYRRPLPIANLRFQTSLMWDGRESSILTGTQDITAATNPTDLLTDLFHQSITATRIHAEATSDPTTLQQQEIVNLEMELSAAQSSDSVAGSLQADGATGGPFALSSQPPTVGTNDPTLPGFNPTVFTLFNSWANLAGSPANLKKASIARGEDLFNTMKFVISDVPGLTDQPGMPSSFVGTCSTCHNAPNVGNRSIAGPLNIGVSNWVIPCLDTSYLPIITVQNNANPVFEMQMNDPGLAMITGKWVDMGKMKVPILRGLASRPPYFHNGTARNLIELVNFYGCRFGITFTQTDITDLVAFLNAL